MKLIDMKTGRTISPGDSVTDLKGDRYIIHSFREPEHDGGTISVIRHGSCPEIEITAPASIFSLTWTNDPKAIKVGDRIHHLMWRLDDDVYNEMWEAVLREKSGKYLSFEGMDRSGNPIWADIDKEDIMRC